MVGLFSRFSVGKNIHRRTQSALVRKNMIVFFFVAMSFYF